MKKNLSKSFPYCPITLGVRFLDQSQKIEIFDKLIFENIAFPLLLVPFLSRSSELIGKKILYKFDQNEFLLSVNIYILANQIQNQIVPLADKIEVHILDNKDNFTLAEWNNLYHLSEETFVAETESSKQSGAGAGLTDND